MAIDPRAWICTQTHTWATAGTMTTCFCILFPGVCRLLGRHVQSVSSVLLPRLSHLRKSHGSHCGTTGVGQTLLATVLHLCVCASSYARAVLESWRPRHNSWSLAYDCPVCFEWTDGRVENHVSDVTHSLPHALLTSHQCLSFSLSHSLFVDMHLPAEL